MGEPVRSLGLSGLPSLHRSLTTVQLNKPQNEKPTSLLVIAKERRSGKIAAKVSNLEVNWINLLSLSRFTAHKSIHILVDWAQPFG